MKLTRPQRDVLTEAARDRGVTCNESYAPARKLIALGLVTARNGSFGTQTIKATDAGLAEIGVDVISSHMRGADE